MEKDKIGSPCKLLIIGGSAGSLDVLLQVVPRLRNDLPFPIVLVLHRKSSSDSMLAELLASRTSLTVHEIEDKQTLLPRHILITPADYHLLFENETLLCLDYSEKINYSRPSIDVAFESAADIFGPSLACLLLSGANADGIAGLKLVKKNGGRVFVQDPGTASVPYMPEQAILNVKVDLVLKTGDIATFINKL